MDPFSRAMFSALCAWNHHYGAYPVCGGSSKVGQIEFLRRTAVVCVACPEQHFVLRIAMNGAQIFQNAGVRPVHHRKEDGGEPAFCMRTCKRPDRRAWDAGYDRALDDEKDQGILDTPGGDAFQAGDVHVRTGIQARPSSGRKPEASGSGGGSPRGAPNHPYGWRLRRPAPELESGGGGAAWRTGGAAA